MTQRQPQPLILVLLGLGCASLAGILLGLLSPSYAVLLPLVFGGVSLAGVYWIVRTRPLKWLDPLVWMLLPLVVQLSMRPLFDVGEHQSRFFTYYILPYVARTSLVTLFGLGALLVGYVVFPIRAMSAPARRLPSSYDTDRVVFYTRRLAVIAVVGYGIFVASSGASLQTLVAAGLPHSGASTAYFGLCPQFAVPICLLLVYIGLERRRWILVASGVAIAVPLTLVFSSVGNRFYALFLIGGLTLYPIIRFRWRPSPVLVAAGVFVALIFISATARLGATENQPSVATALEQTAIHPLPSLRYMVEGPTLNEFDGLATEVKLIPNTISYHPFTALGSVISQPIPRSLWPQKPRYPEEEFDQAAFGEQMGIGGVALSIMGGFYFDSGIVGVIVGMIVIGTVLRALSDYLGRLNRNAFEDLALAALLPLIVQLARGNPQSTLTQGLFVVLPLPVIGYLARSVPARLRRT